MKEKLTRIPEYGYLGGVCAGIAQRNNQSARKLRIILLMLSIFLPIGQLLIGAYILLWIILPRKQMVYNNFKQGNGDFSDSSEAKDTHHLLRKLSRHIELFKSKYSRAKRKVSEAEQQEKVLKDRIKNIEFKIRELHYKAETEVELNNETEALRYLEEKRKLEIRSQLYRKEWKEQIQSTKILMQHLEIMQDKIHELEIKKMQVERKVINKETQDYLKNMMEGMDGGNLDDSIQKFQAEKEIEEDIFGAEEILKESVSSEFYDLEKEAYLQNALKEIKINKNK